MCVRQNTDIIEGESPSTPFSCPIPSQVQAGEKRERETGSGGEWQEEMWQAGMQQRASSRYVPEYRQACKGAGGRERHAM